MSLQMTSVLMGYWILGAMVGLLIVIGEESWWRKCRARCQVGAVSVGAVRGNTRIFRGRRTSTCLPAVQSAGWITRKLALKYINGAHQVRYSVLE